MNAPAPGRVLTGRPSEHAARVLREGGGLVAAAPLWLWWAIWRGAFPASVWTAGLVYLAAVSAVLAWAAPPRRDWMVTLLKSAAGWALTSLLLLTALAGLSVTWASDGGSAWAGADRLVLVALAFALPLLWPPSPRALRAGCAILVLAALLGGVAALIGAARHPHTLADGRLPGPTGYPNASAALFAMAMVVALALAARRELAPRWRALALGAAAPLGGLGLLTQSRGVVAAVSATLLVAMALSRHRLRLLAATALTAGGLAAAAPTLLDVRHAVLAHHPQPALRHATLALLVLAIVMLVVGSSYAAIDARLRPGPRAQRGIRLGARVLAVALVLAGVAAFVAAEGDPLAWTRARWHDFKTPAYARLESSSSRFTGNLGSNRYDYWRVAADLAAAHPLNGVGIDNFAEPYLARRRTLKGPAYAHSIWMEAAADLGIPGLALFVVFVVSAATAAIAAARTPRGDPARGVPRDGLVQTDHPMAAPPTVDGAPRGAQNEVIPAILPAIYLLFHASADWLQAFPALTVPACGLLAGAIAQRHHVVTATADVAPSPPSAGSALPHRPLHRPVASAAVAALLAATALPLFAGARLIERATSEARTAAAPSLTDFDRAADIEPLAAAPLLNKGIVALSAGLPGVARDAFAHARARDPHNWFLVFMLGALDAHTRPAQARAELTQALRLDPLDPELRRTAVAIHRGRPPDPRQAMDQALSEGG